MTFAGSEQDVEYELEEVWDGAQWHVVHKLVPKKTDIGINYHRSIIDQNIKLF